MIEEGQLINKTNPYLGTPNEGRSII